MKTIFILLATVAFAAAAQENLDPVASRSISSSMVKAIESIRSQLPCGFPDQGIPPLAPLDIKHHEVNIDTEYLQLTGVVNNFLLNGLNDFDVAEMNVNPITSKAEFHFVFKDVNVDTEYDLKTRLEMAGLTINMVGAGRARFAVIDMHISGTLKYSFSLLSGKMKLKSLDGRTRIGKVKSDITGILGNGAINRNLNKLLEEFVTIVIKEKEQEISQTIEKIVLPKVNDILKNYGIRDLLGIIDGQTGKCTPSSK